MNSQHDRYLEQASRQFGTPSYIYFAEDITERISKLRSTFRDQFDLSYAVKCNPNPALLGWLSKRVDLLDISSIGEFRLALEAGWDPSCISFTGPAKSQAEIEEAVSGGLGLLVIESLREARIAHEWASKVGLHQPVLLRVSPDSVPRGFGDQMAGRPSPFGVDLPDALEALQQITAMSNLRLVGIHIYSGTQSLKPDAIVENYRGFLTIFENLCAEIDLTPEFLVMGAGLGVAYHDGDVPLPLDDIAAAILPDIEKFKSQPRFEKVKLNLELGRYLVAEAGYFLTNVVSIKHSRGVRIAICDGGMNNHLPASGHFGMVIRRNYKMHRVGGGFDLEAVDVSGPLCTSIDKLGSGVMLSHLEEGDTIAIHNSGAYGLTASPIHFISHPAPTELWVDGGNIQDISRRFLLRGD